MKDRILELIKTQPKHYAVLIKKNKELLDWVYNNSLIQTDKFIEMVYSALNNETNICKYGNKKTISRLSQGWVGCGPANICKSENLFSSGYRRYWDCGQDTWILNRN